VESKNQTTCIWRKKIKNMMINAIAPAGAMWQGAKYQKASCGEIGAE